MASRQPLGLHHEIALLALRNDRGTVARGIMFPQAAGGAILSELLLSDRLRTTAEGRSTYVAPGSGKLTADDVLDECLRKVSDAKRPAKLAVWVQRFARVRRLRHRVAEDLVNRGILREDEGRFLLLFTRRIYPERDPAFERAIVGRLESAIFTDGVVDVRTSALLAIGHYTGLLRANFDKRRLKMRKARLDAIAKSDPVAIATKQAVAAAHAAAVG